MNKVESSAIYYALFLSIIFALILGGLILFSGFNKNFAARLEVQQLVIDNANSGIAYGQVHFKEISDGDPLKIRLFKEGIDSVEISKEQWGAFVVIKSTGMHKKTRHTKIALMGANRQGNLANLYMSDNGRPLSICGDTRIEGNVFLPKSGVKRAYISGQNYQGNSLIYGDKKVAERQLPSIAPSFLENILNWKSTVLPWEDDFDTLNNSFLNEALHFISDGDVSLKNQTINGHIIIEVKDSIYIDGSTHINNAIIKARRIYIGKGFKGQFQAIASEKIVLEENVKLTYPSVVGILEKEFPTEKNAAIVLRENAQILGTVFLVSEKPNFRKLPILKIAKKSEIDGLVYCQGKTELKGIVNGSLYTNKFYLKTSASAYENHILDGQILDNLPRSFVFVSLFEKEEKLKQIQWLN